MNDEEKKLFDTWKSEYFSIIISAFKTVIEETGPMPIEAFNCLVTSLAQEALNTFTKELGIESPEDTPRQFSTDLCVAIIGGFNSALPRDYEYIIIGIFSNKSQNLRIGVLKRKDIPGHHDIVNTNIAPIIRLENIELPQGVCVVKNIEIDSIDFGNDDDDLEKMI